MRYHDRNRHVTAKIKPSPSLHCRRLQNFGITFTFKSAEGLRKKAKATTDKSEAPDRKESMAVLPVPLDESHKTA
jgi:hypothetical protein